MKERILGFASAYEDLILYHVLKEYEKIFYIDVGANDPWFGNVSKIFYERGGRGINIEPQKALYKLLVKDRPRDINLCCALGDKNDIMKLYIPHEGSGLSTLVKDVLSKKMVSTLKETTEVKVCTLESIVNDYKEKLPNDIHFLKIDVEGFEKEVLLGCRDFNAFRPWVIVMESTKPNTEIPCYQDWENILDKNSYTFAEQYGINRYYIANEHIELSKRFINIEKLLTKYDYVSMTKYRTESQMYYYIQETPSWKITKPIRVFREIITWCYKKIINRRVKEENK